MLKIFILYIVAFCATIQSQQGSHNLHSDIWYSSNPKFKWREVLKNKGLKKEEHKFVNKILPFVNMLVAKSFGVNVRSSHITPGDVLFTPDQINQVVSAYIRRKFRHKYRNKRNFRNFDGHGVTAKKWKLPIYYKMDKDFEKSEEKNILDAIKRWEKHTCVRFKRIENAKKSLPINHLIFVSKNEKRCSSFIGRIRTSDECRGVCPQPLTLGTGCADDVSTPLHEIGHALGLHHEHERPDRDKYIVIMKKHIEKGSFHNFKKTVDSKIWNIPYDYGSIMHYDPLEFNKIKKSNTIESRDPLFQKSMGQEACLSFYDIKKINKAYCEDTCSKLHCLRGGYANPNDCTHCLCPDGFGGKYCHKVAESDSSCHNKLKNKELIYKVDVKERCIHSPTVKLQRKRCNWYLKAPEDKRITVYFKSDFHIHDCKHGCCMNWVEIKYKGKLDAPGPRFCGNSKPNLKLTSEGNEVMITLRTHHPRANSRGFTLCYKTHKKDDKNKKN